MVSASRRTYEWKVVVCILELGIIGVDLINKERNCFAVFVAFDRPTCSAIISRALGCTEQKLRRHTRYVESFSKCKAHQQKEPFPQS